METFSNINIPTFLETSQDLDSKNFKKVIKNITLKLYTEAFFLNLGEVLDIQTVKEIHLLSRNGYIYFKSLGVNSDRVSFNETTLARHINSDIVIYHTTEFQTLKPTLQKKILRQIDKKLLLGRSMLRGMDIYEWNSPFSKVAREVLIHHKNGFVINQENKSSFVNQFLPNGWGEARANYLEAKHLESIIGFGEEKDIKPEDKPKRQKI
jgi:hypothetical protein